MDWDWTIRRKPDFGQGSSETIRQVSNIGVFVELNADWVVGFVDGEGCFHVSLNRHDEMTAGYQVLPEFVVVQHERDVQILHALKRFFGAGVVRRNHGDRQCLRIRKFDALVKVCEFFQAHPLKTKKSVDFVKFRKIIHIMSCKRHLEKEGLLEVVDLASAMNTSERPRLSEIRSRLVG